MLGCAMNLKISIECPALDRIADELAKINETLTPPGASRIQFFLVAEDGTLKRWEESMFQKVTEPKKFAIKVTDKFGNDAKFDGLPVWASTDPSLVDIVPAADGMTADVTPKGPLGTYMLQAHVDADMTEGVNDILGESEAIELLAGDAEKVVISEVVPAP